MIIQKAKEHGFSKRNLRSSVHGLIHNYPLIFFLLCFLSYGLLLPFIGYYLDDWYLIWFKHVFGVIDLIKYFNLDRPLMSYFFIVANFILGGSEKPIVWQLFGIFTRWLSVVSLWQMLNTIWPNSKRQNTFVALLAIVYPGFSQQWVAVIYSFFFTCLAGFFFSITLMLKAIRQPKNFWIFFLSSLMIMAYVIPASEFFIGLEIIRPLVLWFEFQNNGKNFSVNLKKIGIYSFPYLVILALFIFWRVFIFNSTNHEFDLNNWFTGDIYTIIIRNLSYLFQAIIDSTVNTWGNAFNLDNYPSDGITPRYLFGMVLIVFFAFFLWLKGIKPSIGEKDQINLWRNQAPILGIFSLVFAILPFWSANLPIDYNFPYDRFLLAFLFGSCLIIVWMFESLGFNEIKTSIVIALLISVGMGFQVANANFYKNLWSIQTQFLWQLNWRIPGLVQNTTVQTYQFPETNYWTGHAISSFLNWTYSDTNTDRKIDYLFIILNSGQKNSIPDLGSNQPIVSNFRTYTFDGNTSQSVFIYFTTDGCLRVLDSRITSPNTVIDGFAQSDINSNNDQEVKTTSGAKLTDLSLIINGNGGHPPIQIIGNEPVDNWCYYFEKAEFSRQVKDYKQVVFLYNEAINRQFKPMHPTEYYPFIDSYARTGDWRMAEKLTNDLKYITSPALKNGLCNIWERLGSDFPDQRSIPHMLDNLNCR